MGGYFIFGGILAMAFVAWRFAVDLPRLKPNRWDDMPYVSFGFVTALGAVLLVLAWPATAFTYALYKAFTRFVVKKEAA